MDINFELTKDADLVVPVHRHMSFGCDTLLWPAYATGISLLFLLYHSTIGAVKRGTIETDTLNDHYAPTWRTYVGRLGGAVILSFKTLRLLCCIALFVLQTVTLFEHDLKRAGGQNGAHFIYAHLPQVFLCVTFVSFIFSIIHVFSSFSP